MDNQTEPIEQPRNPVGRPSSYDPKFCEEIVNYFSVEPFEVLTIHISGKNGYQKEEPKLLPCRFPTLERFACNINVNTDTLVEWAKNHPEFSAAYEKAKHMQKDILVTNGLNGQYASNFAIFVAKNFTDMKDKSETDITTLGKEISSPYIFMNTKPNEPIPTTS